MVYLTHKQRADGRRETNEDGVVREVLMQALEPLNYLLKVRTHDKAIQCSSVFQTRYVDTHGYP